jgi:hypothetical protein
MKYARRCIREKFRGSSSMAGQDHRSNAGEDAWLEDSLLTMLLIIAWIMYSPLLHLDKWEHGLLHLLQPDSIKYRCNFYDNDVILFSRSIIYEVCNRVYPRHLWEEEDFTWTLLNVPLLQLVPDRGIPDSTLPQISSFRLVPTTLGPEPSVRSDNSFPMFTIYRRGMVHWANVERMGCDMNGSQA